MKLADKYIDWHYIPQDDSQDRIDNLVGDRIAEVVGDTFIDHDDMSPASQWGRIARILRLHGIDLSVFVLDAHHGVDGQPLPIGADW